MRSDIKINRLYEENYNYQNSLMKIIKYNNANDITIKFQDENKFRKNTTYQMFENGSIKNVYIKEIYGVGCFGDTKIKNKKSYDTWKHMLCRCYENSKKNQTYFDVSVCDEWLCYANFEKWYDENYYDIDNEIMDLDKDILVKGNKIYSPNNCIFAPHRINSLFLKKDKKRKNCLLGVSYDVKTNKYKSQLNHNGKKISLGYFNNKIEAFYAYKNAKENYIKQVADEYKDKIPKKLYNAMYKWEIGVND